MDRMNRRPEISSYQIRRIILEQSHRARVGHVGCALSVADLVAVLYGGILNVPGPGDPRRDRFILGKGHAALALYAALHLRGWIGEKELNTFCADGTRLGVHPEHTVPGVDFSTGSLGQSLCMAAGSALGARLQKRPSRTFVLLSDAECNEGSIWEAAMFAAHHKLAGLVAIIDFNGQQAMGFTKDILDPGDMRARWEAFGWDAREVDGHDHREIREALEGLDTAGGPPHAVIARTVFGRGVSFMEDQVKWHYWPMSDVEYAMALEDIEGIPE